MCLRCFKYYCEIVVIIQLCIEMTSCKEEENRENVEITQFYILPSLKGSKNSLCKLGKTEFNDVFFISFFYFLFFRGGDNREGKTKASLIDFF